MAQDRRSDEYDCGVYKSTGSIGVDKFTGTTVAAVRGGFDGG